MNYEQLSEQLDQFSDMVRQQFGKLNDRDIAAICDVARDRIEKRYVVPPSVSDKEAENLRSADPLQDRHQPN